MSLFHPHRLKIEANETNKTPYSKEEMKSLKDLITKGSVLKSFKKGRARTGDIANSSGLSIESSNFSSMEDATNELQKKRLLHKASENVIVQAILRTRDAQLLKFCHPARYSNNNVGFNIKPKHVASNGQLTKHQENDIKRIEAFIYNTGCPDADRPSRDKFPGFIAKLIRNKYVYDQVNIERIFDPDQPSKLDHFNMVDGGTVVLNKTPLHEDDKRTFLQFEHPNQSQGNRKNAVRFDERHLTFITSHGGDVGRHGYGYGNVEAALNELQYEKDTESFNARFFQQGGTTRGILLIDTEQDTQASNATLKNLRQQWQSTAQGLSGAWKIPVISAHDAKFVNMTQSSKDMEFERWLNYLINVVCAAFQIQPDEINFPNRGGISSRGAGNSAGGAQNSRRKFQQSRDKGLIPLMDFIQHIVNDHILKYYAPQYYFVFTLGDDKDEQRHEQIMQLKESNGMTINEWRVQEGLPKLTYGKEDFNGKSIFDVFPGDAATVVQQYNAFIAQQKTADTTAQDAGAATQNKMNQAQSDVRNINNPNHQNTVVATNQSGSQQAQQQQDKRTNRPNSNS